MKKIAALILSILMIFELCACGHKEEIIEEENGVTEEESLEIYNKEDGVLDREITYNPNGLKCATVIYEYDGSGNIVKEQFLGVNDAPTGYNSYEYNSEGLKTSMHRYEATEPEEYVEEYYIVYEYDNTKALKKEIRYLGDIIASVRTCEYDADGSLINEKNYEGESELIAEYEYSYDENGRQISVLRHDYMENEVTENRFTYNAEGKLLSDIRYDENGNILRRSEYSYDKNGNETKCSVYSDKGELMSATENKYTYDEPGNIIKCVCTHNDGTQGSVIEYCWTYSKG